MAKSLGSTPSGFMVPIEVNAEYSSSKIFTMLLIVGILLGILMWMYFRSNTKRKTSQEELRDQYISLVIHNVTNTAQRIDAPGNRSFMIEPQKTANVNVPYGSVLSASSFLSTGELIKDTFRADFDASKGDIYITPSGLTSSTGVSMGVKLVNMAKYPVLFVERSKDGKRMWGSNIVPSGSYETRDYVGGGMLWNVYHPTDESNPIATVITGHKNIQLTFDGKSLVSE